MKVNIWKMPIKKKELDKESCSHRFGKPKFWDDGDYGSYWYVVCEKCGYIKEL